MEKVTQSAERPTGVRLKGRVYFSSTQIKWVRSLKEIIVMSSRIRADPGKGNISQSRKLPRELRNPWRRK